MKFDTSFAPLLSIDGNTLRRADSRILILAAKIHEVDDEIFVVGDVIIVVNEEV